MWGDSRRLSSRFTASEWIWPRKTTDISGRKRGAIRIEDTDEDEIWELFGMWSISVCCSEHVCECTRVEESSWLITLDEINSAVLELVYTNVKTPSPFYIGQKHFTVDPDSSTLFIAHSKYIYIYIYMLIWVQACYRLSQANPTNNSGSHFLFFFFFYCLIMSQLAAIDEKLWPISDKSVFALETSFNTLDCDPQQLFWSTHFCLLIWSVTPFTKQGSCERHLLLFCRWKTLNLWILYQIFHSYHISCSSSSLWEAVDSWGCHKTLLVCLLVELGSYRWA